MNEENCQTEDEMELPLYNCHKQVRALKIAKIRHHDHGATICPAEGEYSAFDVDNDYINKHDPVPGGYFVLYKDGYTSYSPAEPFEAGYTLASQAPRQTRNKNDGEVDYKG